MNLNIIIVILYIKIKMYNNIKSNLSFHPGINFFNNTKPINNLGDSALETSSSDPTYYEYLLPHRLANLKPDERYITNDEGQSFLIIALISSLSPSIILKLIDDKMILMKDNNSCYPLVYAIIKKYDFSIIKLLITPESNIGYDEMKVTPLLLAIKLSLSDDTINALINKNNINHSDINNKNALIYAIDYNASNNILSKCITRSNVIQSSINGYNLINMAVYKKLSEETINLLLKAIKHDKEDDSYDTKLYKSFYYNSSLDKIETLVNGLYEKTKNNIKSCTDEILFLRPAFKSIYKHDMITALTEIITKVVNPNTNPILKQLLSICCLDTLFKTNYLYNIYDNNNNCIFINTINYKKHYFNYSNTLNYISNINTSLISTKNKSIYLRHLIHNNVTINNIEIFINDDIINETFDGDNILYYFIKNKYPYIPYILFDKKDLLTYISKKRDTCLSLAVKMNYSEEIIFKLIDDSIINNIYYYYDTLPQNKTNILLYIIQSGPKYTNKLIKRFITFQNSTFIDAEGKSVLYYIIKRNFLNFNEKLYDDVYESCISKKNKNIDLNVLNALVEYDSNIYYITKLLLNDTVDNVNYIYNNTMPITSNTNINNSYLYINNNTRDAIKKNIIIQNKIKNGVCNDHIKEVLLGKIYNKSLDTCNHSKLYNKIILSKILYLDDDIDLSDFTLSIDKNDIIYNDYPLLLALRLRCSYITVTRLITEDLINFVNCINKNALVTAIDNLYPNEFIKRFSNTTSAQLLNDRLENVLMYIIKTNKPINYAKSIIKYTDLNHVDIDGNTVLFYIINNKYYYPLLELVITDDNINKVNLLNETILHYAICLKKPINIIKKLCIYSDLSYIDIHGNNLVMIFISNYNKLCYDLPFYNDKNINYLYNLNSPLSIILKSSLTNIFSESIILSTNLDTYRLYDSDIIPDINIEKTLLHNRINSDQELCKKYKTEFIQYENNINYVYIIKCIVFDIRNKRYINFNNINRDVVLYSKKLQINLLKICIDCNIDDNDIKRLFGLYEHNDLNHILYTSIKSNNFPEKILYNILLSTNNNTRYKIYKHYYDKQYSNEILDLLYNPNFKHKLH